MEQIFQLNPGQMTLRESAGKVHVAVQRPGPGQGLYRAYLLGKGGRLDLGTLLPEGGGLRLQRAYSLDHLRRQGCWPATGGRLELTYAFGQGRPAASPSGPSSIPKGWHLCRRPEGLFGEDPVLSQAAAQAGPCCLCRREAGDFCLAYPWQPQRPFPVPPIFCFAQVKRFQGQPHVTYHFTREGRPAFWEED